MELAFHTVVSITKPSGETATASNNDLLIGNRHFGSRPV